MKSKNKFKNLISKACLAFILLLLAIMPCFSMFGFSSTFAATEGLETIYSDVLEDLQKDENFDLESYPVNNEDYSLQVIQIAESVDKELFVYVYQPCTTKDLTATTISISTGINDNAKWELYNLTLLSKESTLLKYKVKDFEVLSDALRYYDVTEIHRKWVEGIDKETGNDNTIDEVAFEVSRLWTACSIDGKVTYSVLETETIHIIDKYVGYVRYGDGYSGVPGMGLGFYKPGYDSHFVAFSTDKDIDRLLEADVYYETQSYSYYYDGLTYKDETFGKIVEEDPAELSYDKKTTIVDHYGNVSNSHEFERIQTLETFLKTENLKYVYDMGLFDIERELVITDEGFENLKDKQWVLRFVETEYEDRRFQVANSPLYGSSKKRTIVGNVSILRLKFETDGVVYNLGAVDNKQTGGPDPVNKENISINWEKLLQILKYIGYGVLALVAVGIVICIIFFFDFFLKILKGVGKVFKWIGEVIVAVAKGVWWFLTIPYKLLNKD